MHENEQIEYTLMDDRTPKKGTVILKKAEDIQVGDLITEWRTAAENNLPVFFEVHSIGHWGVHEKVAHYNGPRKQRSVLYPWAEYNVIKQ